MNNPYQSRWRPLTPKPEETPRPQALWPGELRELTQQGLTVADLQRLDGLVWRLWQHRPGTDRLTAIGRAYRLYESMRRRARASAAQNAHVEARQKWQMTQRVDWADGLYMPWADKVYTDQASARRDAAARGYRELGDQGVQEQALQRRRSLHMQGLRQKQVHDANMQAIKEATALVAAGQYLH